MSKIREKYRGSRTFARDIALLSLLSALAISSNYVLISVPNVKLMDVIIFASSLAMGMKFGTTLAVVIWIIYGTLNPWGFSLPTLVIVILSEMIYVLFSKIALSFKSEWGKASSYDSLFLGSLGFFSTLIYDIVTNSFVGYLFYGSVIMGLLTMNFPIPMGLMHEVSNAFLFPIATPVIYSMIRRVESKI
ncbi:MAG: hypothetical protein FGF52_01865 [Candidatus Brockarchaeota archaeon]|nr:hypothetical protein [Candidatus Brockarchaeota archaeon]